MLNRFDPESINSEDLILPRDLNNFQELVYEALGEIEQKIIPKSFKAPKKGMVNSNNNIASMPFLKGKDNPQLK